MPIDNIRARITASVWQSIAQSGVDISALTKDQQEKLVSTIADNLMITVNDMLDESPAAKEVKEEMDEHGEQVLWEGRPFLSLVEYYVLTSERLKIRQGLLGREIENFELIRIQDIDYKQGMTERIFGIGDIIITGHDPSDPQIELRNVSKPEEVYETLRRAWLDARKRYGLQFREYM
ncbi:MAG: PH domain-containing protein [Anaerolineales bacterium]